MHKTRPEPRFPEGKTLNWLMVFSGKFLSIKRFCRYLGPFSEDTSVVTQVTFPMCFSLAKPS